MARAEQWVEITTLSQGAYEVEIDVISDPVRYRHRRRGMAHWKSGKPERSR